MNLGTCKAGVFCMLLLERQLLHIINQCYCVIYSSFSIDGKKKHFQNDERRYIRNKYDHGPVTRGTRENYGSQ